MGWNFVCKPLFIAYRRHTHNSIKRTSDWFGILKPENLTFPMVLHLKKKTIDNWRNRHRIGIMYVCVDVMWCCVLDPTFSLGGAAEIASNIEKQTIIGNQLLNSHQCRISRSLRESKFSSSSSSSSSAWSFWITFFFLSFYCISVFSVFL